MQTYKEMVEEAKTKYDKVKAILNNPEASDGERESVEALIKEADDLKARAMQSQEIEKKAREMLAQQQAGDDDANDPEADKAKANGQGGGEKKWADWGEFLEASWYALHPNSAVRKVDQRLRQFVEREYDPETKQLVENVGASGGFLVPMEFQAQLRAVMGERAIIRPRATIIRMNRRQLTLPVLDQTGTTANQGHWFGGMVAYWTEEAKTKTKSEPEFRQKVLTAHKLIVYTRASDELLADSAISLGDFLAGPMGMAGCVAWHEDWAFLQGTGVGQPQGIVGAGATITVARQATSPAFQFTDAANMMENFLPGSRGVWIINQSLMSDVITMNGPTGNPSYIWQPNARDGVPGALLGNPVIWTEKNPTSGTAGDVILCDPAYYLVGDREGTTVESTQYDYWAYDQTSWRAVHRVDGQPWLSSEITLADGTSTVSPFVILGDKST